MSTILKLKVDSSKPILRGHDHYWNVIRQLTEVDGKALFSPRDIDEKCAGNLLRDVRLFLTLLMGADFIVPVGARGAEKLYRLIRRPIDTPVLSRNGKTTAGQVQQNLWHTMCYGLKGGFKTRDLMIMASTEEVPVSLNTAKSYVKTLNKASLFIVRGKGVATTYRLKPSAITGPKAPKILRSKMVYDANTESIIGEVIAKEASS